MTIIGFDVSKSELVAVAMNKRSTIIASHAIPNQKTEIDRFLGKCQNKYPTPEEWRAKLDEFFSAKNAEHLDPIAGSIPAIDALKRAGHELYIITARSDEDIEATELWLKLHFPETFKGVHYGQALSEDPAKKRLKSAMCKELGIELLIDDHMSNAKDCSTEGIKVFLLDQPWNQGELPEGVERVHSWDEIVRRLQ